MALKEFHTDVDLKGRLYVGGSAGSAGQVLISQGPDSPAVWGVPSGNKDYGLITGSVTGTLDYGALS